MARRLRHREAARATLARAYRATRIQPQPPLASTRPIYGFHAVTARLRQRPDSLRAIYLSSRRHDARTRDLIARADAVRCPVEIADDEMLQTLAGSVKHQGVVALVDPSLAHVSLDDVLDGLAEPALLLVLDGVTDPHNLGACLRNADAFGAHAIVVPKDRAVGMNATVAKAASGAADTVPLVMVTNLARALRDLKSMGVWILGAEAGGESLFDADVTGPIAWVLGAEGAGLRRLTRELCDRIVGIPLTGSVESLNVSVASGICFYATRRGRDLGPKTKTP